MLRISKRISVAWSFRGRTHGVGLSVRFSVQKVLGRSANQPFCVVADVMFTREEISKIRLRNLLDFVVFERALTFGNNRIVDNSIKITDFLQRQLISISFSEDSSAEQGEIQIARALRNIEAFLYEPHLRRTPVALQRTASLDREALMLLPRR